MAFLSSLNISGSALTAQKLRMEVVAQNLANANTTSAEDGGAYRRKTVVLAEKRSDADFDARLSDTVNEINSFRGIEAVRIEEADDFVLEYDPSNPLAGEDGYVRRPNINTTEEMIEMIAASRLYEANITAFNAVKDMALKALEIGK